MHLPHSRLHSTNPCRDQVTIHSRYHLTLLPANNTTLPLPKATMPYLIQVPGIPRPYITNDPRIYMDCARLLHWPCEARPFSDSYCKLLRAAEDARHEAERRREQLQAYWLDHLGQLRLSEAAAIPLPVHDDDLGIASLPDAHAVVVGVVVAARKHVKHDSVHQESVRVAEQPREEQHPGRDHAAAWDRPSRKFGFNATFDGSREHDAHMQGMMGPLGMLRRWAMQTDGQFTPDDELQ